MKHNSDFITIPAHTQPQNCACTYPLKPMPKRTPKIIRLRRQKRIKMLCIAILVILAIKLLSCFRFVGGRITWLDTVNNKISVTTSDGNIYEFKADTDTYRLHAPIFLIMFDNNTLDVTDDIIIGDTH